MDSTGKKIATVQSSGTKHPPTLSSGTLTPETLSVFERHCLYHFIAKKIDDKDQVATIASGFHDPLVQTWYFNDFAKYNALTFTEFMGLVHKRWLKKNWQDELRTRISRSRQREEESFDEWIENLERLNNLLVGHALLLDESGLRQHIKAYSCAEVREYTVRSEVSAVADYLQWKALLGEFDDRHRADRARRDKEIESYLRRFPTKGTSHAGPQRNTSSSDSTSKVLPKLTDEERSYLRENEGCFKCRKVRAGHTAASCPNGYPDAATYKALVPTKSTTGSTWTKAPLPWQVQGQGRRRRRIRLRN